MKNLKRLRAGKGVPQQVVADYLGITRQAYSNYESGNRDPDHETLLKLAEYFDTTVDFILRGENTKDGKLSRNDVGENVDSLLEDLENAEGLMLYGDPLSEEARASIVAAMKLGMEAAKAKNKEKFTPKKYRKE